MPDEAAERVLDARRRALRRSAPGRWSGARARRRRRRRSSPPGRRSGARARAGASTVRWNRSRRWSRWAARAASNASSSGSIPKPRMCSSPSHSPRSRVTSALISTPGIRVIPAGTARVRDDGPVAGERVVVGQAEDPDAGRRRRPPRAPAGASTPSERVVCVCRSTVDGAGGWTRPWPRRQRVVPLSPRRAHAVTPRRAAGSARSGAPGRWRDRCRPGRR